jgi:hypothetical protein
MSASQYILLICKGAGIGFFVGGAVLFCGDSPHEATARLIDIIDTPVNVAVWILEHIFRFRHDRTAGWWLLFHFGYWMILGGLAGWGFGVIRSKVIGDE